MQGRTYRYFSGKPLYGFGYRLSYTTFAYRGLDRSRHAGLCRQSGHRLGVL